MAPIVVQKYGGSSVADIDKLKLVARRVVETKKAGYDVVVVVSAMGKTTDDLVDLARQINATPSSREMDMLLTVGERISMALLSMAIQALGVPAISFTGSQSGIITTANHTRARIIEVRPFRVMDELEAGKVVIVAGFQGTSYKREITTLGRGGSDTTAVALAAALGADRCEIYSDVDAVHTADPRVTLDARKVEELTYEEMLSLARYGAKVLNAEAVEFARRAGIAIYTRSTFQPEASGTVVRLNPPREPRPVIGVALRKHLFLVRLVCPSNPGGVLRLLEEQTLCVDFVAANPGAEVSLVVRAPLGHSEHGSIEEVVVQALGERSVVVEGGLGSVTVVGDVATCSQMTSEVCRILEDMNDLRGIFLAPTGLSVLLPESRVEEAARLLHCVCIGEDETKSDSVR